MKVYCISCKHNSGVVCKHPNHVKEVDTPIFRTKLYGNRESLNADNDCNMYEEEKYIPTIRDKIINAIRHILGAEER